MLSDRIFSDAPPRFFAVLTSRHCGLYVDVLDRIEKLSRGRPDGGLTRIEVINIIEAILEEANSDISDEEGKKLDASDIVRHLVNAGWLEKPQRADFQSVYYVDSKSELLLESLRKIAYPERVTFTDKLHLACTRLQDEKAFTQHPLSDLEGCLENLRQGLQELRALQQGVARLTQRQLRADSLKENLTVLYDDFSEHIGQRCYKQLTALDLPIRLPIVREALRTIESDVTTIARMEAELTARRPDFTEAQVKDYVRKSLDEAVYLLSSVEPQAEAVDRRAADFARRSFARFRYLQEVSGGRREEMKKFFEMVNTACENERTSDLPEGFDLPALKVPYVGLLGGLNSLYMPRGERITGERKPVAEDIDDLAWDDALEEMSENINSSLTAVRANRFFATLNVPEAGLESSQLAPGDEEWLLEIAGLLLHTDTSDSDYVISSVRENDEEPPTDELGDFAIDRFSINPLSNS